MSDIGCASHGGGNKFSCRFQFPNEPLVLFILERYIISLISWWAWSVKSISTNKIGICTYSTNPPECLIDLGAPLRKCF